MNTRQISSILKQTVVGPKFLGVFASDQLPAGGKVNGPCAFVVNTDPSTKPGSHWIAIFIAADGTAEYFDSYGLEPNVKSILSFLARYSRLGWNTVPVQGPFSSVCGHYCIYFVIQRCNFNRSMNEIVKQFSINEAEENDEMITDWINEQFDVDTDTYDINFLVNQICHSR